MSLTPDSPAAGMIDRCAPLLEARRQEVQSLLQSGVVRENTQLHSLLVYLGEKSIEDPPRPLKEYTIGLEALGKPDDYDPRLDPTVRVEVSKLRKRLKEYYDGPGAAHSLQLTIPKGSYLPVFESLPSIRVAGAPPRPGWARFFWPALSAVLLAALLVLVWRGSAPPSPLAPEVEAFWAPHFNDSTPTTIVFGAPLFLKVQNSFFRDTHVNRVEELNQSPQVRSILEALKPEEVRPAYQFTGLGEAEAIFLLTRVLASRHSRLVIRRSNEISWDDLKDTNVVLIGGRKFNAQIPGLPFNPKFLAEKGKVVNLTPLSGEKTEYPQARKTSHGDVTEDYAVISVYPGFSPNTRMVTLESNSTEGTLAAAEFLTRSDTLRELVSRKLPLPRSAPFRALQVVIGAKFKEGVVVSLSYVTHTVLP